MKVIHQLIKITSADSLVISEHSDLFNWSKLVKHMPDVLEYWVEMFCSNIFANCAEIFDKNVWGKIKVYDFRFLIKYRFTSSSFFLQTIPMKSFLSENWFIQSSTQKEIPEESDNAIFTNWIWKLTAPK